MAYSKTEQIAWQLAEPIAAAQGCFLYDVEYVKEGGVWFLRIFLDQEEGGISLEECEAVSRSLSEVLDREDPIQQNYFLEVASPGVERRLKTEAHFKRYLGETIDVKLYKPLAGSKLITGTLTAYDGKTIGVAVGEENLEIPLSDAALVHLHFEF